MFREKYDLWLKNAVLDPDLIKELESIKNNAEAIEDAFYRDLSFGTGGLRGVIGAGTNRMNIYTVGKATQGLSVYVKSISDSPSVAIAYDSRNKSDVFARAAAQILAANGVKVYIYRELMPTPMLSYAVRYLKCTAGIVITASHNPAKYNGYKAYGGDGSQFGLAAADYVLSIMNKVDIFGGVKRIDFEEGLTQGIIEYIGDDVIESFLDEVEKCRVNRDIDLSGIKVVYTPLNGAGNMPVRKIFKRIGATDVTVVKTQELPNGHFPTAPYPNPEIKEAYIEAFKVAANVNPDLIIATDPDSDRCGAAVLTDGEYKLLTGNEIGTLMFNYIFESRKRLGTLPQNPVAVMSVVSTAVCKKIAAEYNCELREVLTGFKFIGEQITELEEKGEQDRFVFGFEESYGYLPGPYVRDKDAVSAAMIMCEMAAFYKQKGLNLFEVLDGIYEKYGYYLSSQKSFTCEGQAGMKKIAGIMDLLRNNPPKSIGGKDVSLFKDISTSIQTNLITGEKTKINLPKSNVLIFDLENGSSLIVRPSGTEPKIKMYIYAFGISREEAENLRTVLTDSGTKLLGF